MTANTKYGGVVEWSDEDRCFVGYYPGIIGPCCHGDDKDQVYLQLRQIVDEWLEIEYEDREKTPYRRVPGSEEYVDRVKSHLTEYRRNHLGIEQVGTWDGAPYDHILPKELLCLNLIETIRVEVCQYLQESKIRMDRHFHHLNSSQAACINLFWPLLNRVNSDILVKTLGIGPGEVARWEFEKIMDRKEKTNFDLYFELNSGAKTFIEFKYTEEEFGRARDDGQHRQKLKDIYEPALRDFVSPEYLKKKKFFANYQFLRNLIYTDPERGDKVILIVPRANKRIVGKLHKVIESAILDASVRSLIRIRYLEDVVSKAFESAHLSDDDFYLRTHLHLYRQKYFV